MEYKVIETYTDGNLYEDRELLVTEDAQKAQEYAREQAKKDGQLKNAHNFSIEIRFNENEEIGSYETLDFDIWYAVQKNEDDNDWGDGSYDLEEARRMRDKIGNAAKIVKVKENYIFGDSEALEVIE